MNRIHAARRGRRGPSDCCSAVGAHAESHVRARHRWEWAGVGVIGCAHVRGGCDRLCPCELLMSMWGVNGLYVCVDATLFSVCAHTCVHVCMPVYVCMDMHVCMHGQVSLHVYPWEMHSTCACITGCML